MYVKYDFSFNVSDDCWDCWAAYNPDDDVCLEWLAQFRTKELVLEYIKWKETIVDPTC